MPVSRLPRRFVLGIAFCVMAVLAVTDASAQMVEEAWSNGGLRGTFREASLGARAGPAVLIIAGSGRRTAMATAPSFRRTHTGNWPRVSPSPASARCAYDKRGIGKRRALVTREEDVVFSDFVSDAVGGNPRSVCAPGCSPPLSLSGIARAR